MIYLEKDHGIKFFILYISKNLDCNKFYSSVNITKIYIYGRKLFHHQIPNFCIILLRTCVIYGSLKSYTGTICNFGTDINKEISQNVWVRKSWAPVETSPR